MSKQSNPGKEALSVDRSGRFEDVDVVALSFERDGREEGGE
jgi:hypothetical protein